MSGEPGETDTGNARVESVPLYLVPKVIADHIRKKQGEVFLITVCRSKEHQYQILVETLAEHTQRTAGTASARSGGPGDRGGGCSTRG
ncbi:MAG TPA: hypothetical protein P5217_07370 [Methanoregulaceae archaeon]|nr:hypothetical protein [Methanoregulaceae archaeon]HPD76762.1 hypothetical protein [Methanoregulaceae archaeon]HRY76087.1 hypothetical protein [Methanoregulaceae archaeon]